MDGLECDKKTVRVGSRKSQLALVQTHTVIDMLQVHYPDIEFKVITLSTKGDLILDQPLSKIGEKSLFTKELEVALEDLKVDMVVHSLKDLPSTLPPGMAIGAVIQRDSPYDAVVFSSAKHGGKNITLADLPQGAVVGTSSLRRVAQLKRAYPQLTFADVRGNLNTRLRKLDAEDGIYDALILAEAGLVRLGWNDRVHQVLDSDACMYAISQGAMAIECRSFDLETLDLLAPLIHTETLLQCLAERALLRTLEGGCSVPIAASSQVLEGGKSLTLSAGVFSLDGTDAIIQSHTVKLSTEAAPATTTATIEKDDGEPPSKKVRRPSCPYSEVAQGHKVNPESISTRYLDVKRKDCPYFSGIIARSLPHHILECAENVGIDLANKLKLAGADRILTKAKAENDKLKAIMNEERRLNEANKSLLQNIRTEVIKVAGSSTQPLDAVKQAIKDHGSIRQNCINGEAKATNGSTAEPPSQCPVAH